MTNEETVKLVDKAAAYVGGPQKLADRLQIRPAYVRRFTEGRSTPNAIVLAELQRIVSEWETENEGYMR